MTGRGQHDTDRGEHRGPQTPELVSGARPALVGGRQGGLIIALALPATYGRSAKCRSAIRGPNDEDLGRTARTYTDLCRVRIRRMGGITSCGRLRTGACGNT